MTQAFEDARRAALASRGYAAHEDEDGGYLFVPDEVLVAGPGHDSAAGEFRAAEVVQSVPALEVTAYKVPPRSGAAAVDDLTDLIDRFNGDGGHATGTQATLHYVLSGQPVYHGGPGGWPAPEPGVHDRTPSTEAEGEGEGVVVAVLDTGISKDVHPWLEGRCSTDSDADVELPELRSDGRLGDQAGHGTFVAGILLSHATRARVIAAKVLDAEGFTREICIASRMHELATGADPPAIFNLSLGGYTRHNGEPEGLKRAIQALPDGTVVVAAAGNNHSDRPMWPAAFSSRPNVISVGALTYGGSSWPCSNYGPWVETWAVGADVIGPFLQVNETQSVDRPKQDFTGWVLWSGTSFAAPFVAGEIAALMTRDGHETAQAALDALPRRYPSAIA